MERKYPNNNSNNASDSNWRSNSQFGSGAQQSEKNQTAPKNRKTGLNQKSKKKKPNSTSNSNQKPNQKAETVTQEEKKQLGQTLEAIMKRLDAMESRQTTAFYPHPGVHLQPQVQPLMSPAVPQPGTQTQYQWGSSNPWTQSQSQQ